MALKTKGKAQTSKLKKEEGNINDVNKGFDEVCYDKEICHCS